MKRLIPLLFIAMTFASCEKEPDLDKVQNDYVIYTQYDKDANFSKGNTYYIPDSVLVIGNKDKGAAYLDAQEGDFIINAYATQMSSRGYTRVYDKTEATYGLQISYVESTFYYTNSPGWWSDYPWYWTPSYWWPWITGAWYHPYPFIYSYTSGSLVAEMVDITSVSKESSTASPSVIWNNYITDINTPATSQTKLTKAIDQAFAQSTYIQYK